MAKLLKLTVMYMLLLVTMTVHGQSVVKSDISFDPTNDKGNAVLSEGMDSSSSIESTSSQTENSCAAKATNSPTNKTTATNTYTVTITAHGDFGYISCNGQTFRNGSKTFTVEEGENITAYGYPDSGCRITKTVTQKEGFIKTTGEYSDNTPTSHSASVYTLKQNATIDIYFEKIPGTITTNTYTVTVTAHGNYGYINCNGENIRNGSKTFKVDQGNNLTATGYPDESCRIGKTRVQKTGYIGSASDYCDKTPTNHSATIYDLKQDGKIDIYFEEIPNPFPNYTVTVTSHGDHGYVICNGETIRNGSKEFTVEEGMELSAIGYPDELYRIAKTRTQKDGYIGYVSEYIDKTSKSHSASVSSLKQNAKIEFYYEELPKIKAENISLSSTAKSLYINDTETLIATVSPSETTTKTVEWQSSDESIASVTQDGVVTALKVGTCVITAKTTDGSNLSAKCTITVKQQVTAIALSDETASLWVGDTKTITATATPTTANNTAVNWTSSNNNVATVSSEGVITAKGQGTCTITCTAADGYGTTSTCEITVKQQVTSIALSETTTSLWIGDTKTITVKATPTTANDATVNWSSSDDNVATVSSEGVITAKGQGTCTITCTAADGYGTTSTCEVTVKQPVTAIALSDETVSLWVGDTKTITAKTTPTTANNTAVNWTSSNNNVATVSSEGVITAKGKGTCTITCTAADGYGKTSICEVTVKQQVNSITLSNTTVSLWVGETNTITVKATPTTASNTAVEWSSSDNNVVTVSAEGVITANGEGTCIITCTAADGYGTTSTCEVTVKQQVTSIALSETTVSLRAGETKTLTATATPTTAGNTAVEWSSSDNNVATVSAEGVITANGEGTCTITCTAADGYGTTSVCEVTVMQQTTGVEQLRVNNDEPSVYYDLSGQRINKANTQKGVYIKNGKKYAK